jgi:hypothetical protein
MRIHDALTGMVGKEIHGARDLRWVRHKIDGRSHRNEEQTDPLVYQEIILLDIVNVQIVLLDTL